MTEPSLTPSEHVTHIRPQRGNLHLNLPELMQYRELFWFLVWRDLKVLYKQTLLGFAWAVLGPVATTLVFTVIFGNFAKAATDGLPHSIFYMAGIIIWSYFSSSLNKASTSLVGNQALLTKIYLPRLIIPASSILVGLVNFAIGFSILLGLMLYMKIYPGPYALLVPVLVLMTMGCSMGFGLFLAALNVRFRDVRHIIPFVTQLWMYCSIVIPFSELPERFGAWRYLYGLNPMAGIVESFRWCLLGGRMDPSVGPPWMLLGLGAVTIVLMLLVGLFTFRRMENQFADIV